MTKLETSNTLLDGILEVLMTEQGLDIKGIQSERFGNKLTALPAFEVRWDWIIGDVKGLRIDRISASGKTADITVKVKRNNWDPNIGEWSDQVVEQQVDRVRMSKIKSFLQYIEEWREKRL